MGKREEEREKQCEFMSVCEIERGEARQGEGGGGRDSESERWRKIP